MSAQNHDIRVDYVKEDSFHRNQMVMGYRQRYTCWTEGCSGDRVVEPMVGTLRDWFELRDAFLSKHPCYKITDYGLPK
jgi:hypothetical protein